MSIINNANPGSDLNLICMIDRELIARSGTPITKKKLINDIRPSALPTSPNANQKLPETVSFWTNHGLWQSDSGKNEIYLEKELSKQPLQRRLAKSIFDHCNDPGGNEVQPWARVMGCLLALNKFSPLSEGELTHNTLVPTVNRAIPDFQMNESNERKTFVDFSRFLGFLEPHENGRYSVDPTRAIEIFLSDIFGDKKILAVREFISALSSTIPVLDRGPINEWVNEQMDPTQRSELEESEISKSLSFALYRLELGGQLRIDPLADDPNAMKMASTQKEGVRRISSIEWIGAES